MFAKLLLFLAVAFVATNPASAVPCDYDFCPNGITNPIGTVTVTEGEAPCSSIVIFNNADALSEEECADLPAAEIICCPTKQTAQNCFLCGSDMTFNETKRWPLILGDPTPACGVIDNQLSYLNSTATCDSAKSEFFDPDFDIMSYCECENVAPPDICKPCDENQEVNMNAILFDNPDAEDPRVSCGAAFDFARSIANKTNCASVETDQVRKTCCIDKVYDGIGASGGISLSLDKFAMVFGVGLALFEFAI
ncbi:unnamed protein product [Cylindrotheca closterium]|uniref:Uncharacterized protein n=1 Tax=Cylindrotheca closterium TaxID=2856 RepID=A0AAD2CH23_9STRA|nr:unnamed protein product [Cylindrotheca closterium]